MKANSIKPILLLTSLVLGGCGANLNGGLKAKYADRHVASAPQSESETGVVITNASEEDMDKLLQKNSAVHFRVINSNHGLYEVHGLSKHAIAQELPHLNTIDNEFIPMELSQKKIQALDSSSIGKFIALNSDSSEDQRMDPCNQTDLNPKAILSVDGKELTQELLTIEIGNTLKLDASGSKTHPNVGDKLKIAFAIQPPAESLAGDQVSFSETLDFNPDAYGLYQILMIIQDKNMACDYKSLALAVTGNPELQSNVSGQTTSLETFKHLVEMQAEKAWEVATGDGMTIAVLDTGVHYNHPDLNSNIVVNPDEIPGNGIDDDNNGFVDDAFGYDFTNSDSFPYDDVGHGSHVAGLAASSTFGMAKNAKILPLKALGPLGGDLGSILGAVEYAVDNGANILNMSLGSYAVAPNPELVKVMDYAESKGVLVIAASGNGHPQLGIGLNTDKVPNFPSALPNDNIIAVAAKDSDNLLAPYSNYGLETVDITAPGGNGPDDLVVSASFENPSENMYAGMAGTSMATPIVAGVAAQVWSMNPSMSPLEVKDVILNSGLKVEGLDSRTVSGRYLDALKAVNYVQMKAPN